jgi:uncharacterized repeat protein (TIGR03803 family)
MADTRQRHSLKSCLGVRKETGTMLLAIVFVLTIVASPPVQAQTFQTLHNFTGGLDGGEPLGVTVDAAGNLYGPTFCCGSLYGTVYEMQRFGASWVLNSLYIFKGGTDGRLPQSSVVFGSDGLLYGSTSNGGTDDNGTVFNLGPAGGVCRTALCPRTKTVLYNFGFLPDAAGPAGDLTFDQAGNIYGTAGDGPENGGSVYELMRSGDGWIESVLYGFPQIDGQPASPNGGVIFDNAGNLYGTTRFGGSHNEGTVFQLVPGNSGWTENTLYNFQGGSDGDQPWGGLIFDPAGNLYGTTYDGGDGGGGTVFELTPSNGGWTFTTLYSFVGSAQCGSTADLVMDASGSLYGGTNCDGAYGEGNAFRLTPSGGTWTYTSLHDFCASGFPFCEDGYWLAGKFALDPAGNIYGTTFAGGPGLLPSGVLWEITP